MPSSKWLLYGAYGYTGKMIAEEAARRHIAPILAGRDARKLDEIAEWLDCRRRVFDLDSEKSAIAGQLEGVDVALNCAGPFSSTAVPMMEACIEAGVDYLDITGEIDTIENAAAHSGRAKAAGVSLMPAVGCDVVPSDCLALRLARRLPDACRLELAFGGMSAISRGTARTVLEGVRLGGRVRKDGQITTVPLGWKSKPIPFRNGSQYATTIAWGDVATAWHTTGIPDIEVYLAMPKNMVMWMRRTRLIAPMLLKSLPEKAALGLLSYCFMSGAGSGTQKPRQASFWGGVWNERGQSVSATLVTPSAYRLTVLTALACLEKTLAGETPPGFSTPASAFGDDFILCIAGTSFRWEESDFLT